MIKEEIFYKSGIVHTHTKNRHLGHYWMHIGYSKHKDIAHSLACKVLVYPVRFKFA